MAFELICGDCLEELPKIKADSVRLAFLDSPYNQDIRYQNGRSDNLPSHKYLAWISEVFDLTARTLSDDGSFWVLISDEWADEFGIRLKRVGLFRKQWIIWRETFGVNCTRSFNRCTRHLFWMVKDPRNYVFNREAVTRKSDRQTRYNDRRANPAGKVWDSCWGVEPPIPRLTGTCAERIAGFPTQLPLALLRPIVGVASDPGDTILDPMCGSATAGEAAIRLGRHFIGMELSPVFHDLATRRLDAIR